MCPVPQDSVAADGKVEMIMKMIDPERKATLTDLHPVHHKFYAILLTGYISCDQFLHFIHSIPEDQLSLLLSLNILQHDDGHYSEHSSQHTQPIQDWAVMEYSRY